MKFQKHKQLDSVFFQDPKNKLKRKVQSNRGIVRIPALLIMIWNEMRTYWLIDFAYKNNAGHLLYAFLACRLLGYCLYEKGIDQYIKIQDSLILA